MQRAWFLAIGGLLFISFFAYAQAPDTLWTRTYGGTGHDSGNDVKQTYDGGYIITGYTESFGVDLSDLYIVKTDSLGSMEWDAIFGGAGWDCGFCVQQTFDSGYIVVGRTQSFGAGGYDVYLIKLDNSGNTQWDTTYGGNDWDMGLSIQQTADAGYIITGMTESYGAGTQDVYLLKVDGFGNFEWDTTYGGAEWDWGRFIQLTSDGWFVITGTTGSFGAGLHDVYLIKTDSLGNMRWYSTFGGANYDDGFCVQQTLDGGYIVTGRSSSFNSREDDIYLIKADSYGMLEWDTTFGGGGDDFAQYLLLTPDGGYLLAGWTDSQGAGSFDFYLLKTDSQGNLMWDTTYGGSASDWAACIQQTQDGGYIIAGETSSYGAGSRDIYLIKTAPVAGIEKQKGGAWTSANFTSLFGGRLDLPQGKSCKVYDITGREADPEKIKPGVYFIEIDGKIIQKAVKVR